MMVGNTISEEYYYKCIKVYLIHLEIYDVISFLIFNRHCILIRNPKVHCDDAVALEDFRHVVLRIWSKTFG